MLENTPMHFRPAMLDDVAAIHELVRAAYARWIPVIGREPRPMTADYRRAVQQHQFALLCDGSEIVGLIETMMREDHLWIENVAVKPDHQGKGLGRQLLDHAEQAAMQAGHREIRLLTNADFKANVALYRTVGYVTTHEEPFMGGTTLYMSKLLNGGAANGQRDRIERTAGGPPNE